MCNQDSGMGNPYRKPPAFIVTLLAYKEMEFFKTGYDNPTGLMCILNIEKFRNQPNTDLNKMLEKKSESLPEISEYIYRKRHRG